MDKSSTCLLCGKTGVIRDSHVVPSFVFRWLRDTSPGQLRTNTTPNRRVQDGPKRNWLCDECEQRLSRWENEFALKVFNPLHENPAPSIGVKYGPWALKFATSISWRTILFYRDCPSPHLTALDRQSLEGAEKVWRRFMLDQIANLGRFTQHVIVVDAPLIGSGPAVSPFIARYLTRTVQSDIITSSSMCFVYTKLGRVIVIGFIRVNEPKSWVGTLLKASNGTLGGAVTYKVPNTLINYWNQKANQAASIFGKMSSRQREKINDLFRKVDPEILSQTDVFRAIKADVGISGQDAFNVTRGKRTKS